MKHFLKRIGMLFGGFAIIIVSLLPILVTASFFLVAGCDFQIWADQYTNPEGQVMSEGLMIIIMALVTLVFFLICTYGILIVARSTQSSGEELGEMVLDAMKKHVEERQEQCPHDFVHQVGFTNMLQCDECEATFENKHFVSDD